MIERSSEAQRLECAWENDLSFWLYHPNLAVEIEQKFADSCFGETCEWHINHLFISTLTPHVETETQA